MIKKIKEWLTLAAKAIAVFWSDKLVPFFDRIAAALKGMVIIGEDVYFTSKKPLKQGKSPRVFSLYFGLVGSILIGTFLAVIAFLGTRAAAEYYINSVYMTEQRREEREAEYISNLQNFVLEHNITASDADKLREWIEDNRYVFISVYDGEELLFSSIREPANPENPDSPENPENPNVPDDPDASDGDQSGSVGGILSGPTKEELLEQVAKITDTKQIETNGEQVLLVKIYEYTEYLYRDIFTVLSLVLAMVILAVVIVEHFSRIIARVKRLQFDVNAVAEGRMDHEIVATGFDEITKLSYDIDNMRSSMLRNVEKEREALQMNTELITSMSHDIRTPLTVLMGYIDIMKSGLPPEEMEEYDAPTLFLQLLSEHVLLLTESGYKVNYDIDELLSEKLIVRTDAPHLMRIVDNIFSNLYKYASIEEDVSIIGRKVDDLAVFEFKNTATRNAGAESSKVGLKTCKRLAEYILNSFEYGEDEGVFTLTFSMKLYEEGTKISESFIIR